MHSVSQVSGASKLNSKADAIRLSALISSNVSGADKKKRLISAHESVLRRDDRAVLTWNNISFFVPLSGADKKTLQKQKAGPPKIVQGDIN